MLDVLLITVGCWLGGVGLVGFTVAGAYLAAAGMLFRAARLEGRGENDRAVRLAVRAAGLQWRADRLVRFITNGRFKGA